MADAFALAAFVVVAADLGEVLPIEGEDEVIENLGELSGSLVAEFIEHEEARQVRQGHSRSSPTACSRCSAVTVRASLTAAAVSA